MRGRRHKLAVSTFPFLAVLLCAMGSLILILLVMDRKAHHAAQARALREAARLAEQSVASETAQRAELEKKKQQARAAWEQKRDTLHANLTHEQMELQMQMRKVRDQFSQIAARLRYEQDTSTELRHKVQDEASRIKSEELLLATLRSKAGQSEEQSKESSKTVRRMTLDLLQMEQALKDLKAAKKREQHTFSVVPYHGRRGENRQPIYVECTSEGVIFHPERRAMSVTGREVLIGRNQPGYVPDDVRSEVERRIVQQRAKQAGGPAAANATPYLLLLVRPDGINTYGELQAVLKDLTLDFGYEFIDADWVLDFPADEDQPNAQPWMAAAKSPGSTSVAASASAPKRVVGSAKPRAIGDPNAPPNTSGTVAGGFRLGGRSGSGGGLQGVVGQSGTGRNGGTGVRPGGSGPFVAGGVPGGSGSSGAGGMRNVGPSDGRPGVGGGNSFNGTSGPGGGSPGLGGGLGSSLASSGGSGGDGQGAGGSGTGYGRGDGPGHGHPAAMPHPEGGDDGEPGATGGGSPGVNGGSQGVFIGRGSGGTTASGSSASGSPGNFGSGVAGLGTPRALGSGSPGVGGYPGGGSGQPGAGGAGSNVPGSPGGNGTGYPGNGGSGAGSSQTAGSVASGNGIPGSGIPGNGTGGNGVAGNGIPGNGTQGSGVGGNGTPGNGAIGNGMPGSGAIGNGSQGSGIVGNVVPGNGVSGSGIPGNGTSGGNPSGAPSAPGTSPNGGYTVARGNGGEGSGQPGGFPGASAGMMGGTSSGQPGSAGMPGSGSSTAGAPGQGSPGTPGTMGQGGVGGNSANGSGQPGTAGGAPGNASGSAQGGEGSAFPTVDPLAPRSPSGSRPDDGASTGQRTASPPARPPEDTEYQGAPPKRRLVNGGGGSGDGDDSGGAVNRYAPPSASVQRPRKRPAELRPAWLHGGRDWTIYVECRSDAVVLYPSEKAFTLAQAASDASTNPLVSAIQQMIARRQSGRRPGDPPFYPQVRLLVRSDNVRTFLMVYPALEALPVPKTRQNLDIDDDVRDIVRGVNP